MFTLVLLNMLHEATSIDSQAAAAASAYLSMCTTTSTGCRMGWETAAAGVFKDSALHKQIAEVYDQAIKCQTTAKTIIDSSTSGYYAYQTCTETYYCEDAQLTLLFPQPAPPAVTITSTTATRAAFS